MAVDPNKGLRTIAPNGSSLYVALLTTMPDEFGEGAVEASGGGYARVLHTDWIFETTDEISYRKNVGAIEFPTLTAASTVVGVGVYRSISSDTLLGWGELELEKLVKVGEVPRFTDRELELAFSDTLKAFEVTAAEANNWNSVCWAEALGLFVAVSSTGTNRVMTSPDGVTWTPRTAASAQSWTSVCWSPDLGKLCAISLNQGGTNRVMHSTDGITWTSADSPTTFGNFLGGPAQVIWASGLNLFVAVSQTGSTRIMTSPTGVTWTGRTASEANSWNSVVWSDELDLLVAIAVDGTHRVMTSPDGTTWTNRTAAAANGWRRIAWSPLLGLFAVTADDGTNRVMTSPDGTTWTARTTPTPASNWYTLEWAEDLDCFIAVDSTQGLMTSADGISWDFQDLPGSFPAGMALAWCPALSIFVATGNSFAGLVVPVAAITTEIDIVDEDSLPVLQSYLPPGDAWPRDADTEQTALNRALSYEFSRIRRRVDDFFEELDPRTTVEMLEDWERVYGLPDACSTPTTLAGRREALQSKMLGGSDPSRANLIGIAEALGYDIFLSEYKRADMFTCVSPCTDPLYDRSWMYVWNINAWPGEDDAGLTCTLEVTSPSHTLLNANFAEFESQTSASARQWLSVCWSPENELFCAVAQDGDTTNQIMTSPDGITWTSRTSPSDRRWAAVCWSPELSLFCATPYDGAVGVQVMTSPDGITWTSRTSASARQWGAICWSPELNLFCSVAYDGDTTNQIMTSPDGITWTSRTSPSAQQWASVCWSPENELFCAVAIDGAVGVQVMTSPDGITWTSRTSASARQWFGVCWSPELSLFCAVAYDGDATNKIMTSPDGITWTSRTAPSARQCLAVCWSSELGFCAVSDDGDATNQIMTSPDGITWTSRTSPSVRDWVAVCWSPELSRFAAVAFDGAAGTQVMLTSTWRV